MDTKSTSIIFNALLFLALSASASAFNITKMLEKESNFKNFNQYLSDTKLTDQINNRRTITVLAVDNGAVGSIGGKSQDEMKKILSVHVILDYYDEEKLKKLSKSNKSATLTTLYQSTGQARNQNGFLAVGLNNGEISFGSAANGGRDKNAQLVKSVTSQPYNISVLQVSSVINVPDLTGGFSSSPTYAPSPKRSHGPSSSSEDDDDESTSPSKSKDDKSKDDSESPDSPPSPSESDSSDTPSPSPSPSPSSPSGASRVTELGVVGVAGVVVMGLVSVLVA